MEKQWKSLANGNVIDYLEETAAKYPNKIFIADENKSVTFIEAKEIIYRIGSYLLHRLKCKNKPLCVFACRNVESILMFLGVVASGNFYVPINTSIPKQRMRIMLENIKPRAMLCVSMGAENLLFDVPIFSYEEMTVEDLDIVSLQFVRRKFIDSDPVCGIFTSGSTGIPKCVVKSHRSIIAMAEMFSWFFHLSSSDVLGNQVSFDFDMANKDIYTALRNGSTLNIIPKKLYMLPNALVDYLNERRVSVLFWASSALHVMHTLHAFKHKKLEFVKEVMCSGEPISVKALKYWMDNMPQINFWNLYGCTEMTGNCTFYKIPKGFHEEQVPLGTEMPGVNIYLLNEQDNLVGVNEIGEICISGPALSLGYYNNKEKTAEKFVQNPINSAYPEIIYRTGDLAKYDESGCLIFSGRKDDQIKHMGYRIELGDIETVANGMSQLGRSCCIYDSAKDRIVLLYEAENNLDSVIRKFLKDKLPQYMLPGRYVQMKVFPENSHGKIDRKYLEAEYVING
ncbi:AMP-binding protein [Selenomonas sp. KH1T6]|uniref:AMP-binding protein n=1 Tax=Selenomonas sp. KH1T6 TaxID=3158784 RepID=UPI0008A78759|nr:amino acid adenylation domain-containing protein [Selenomonas ruminantium]